MPDKRTTLSIQSPEPSRSSRGGRAALVVLASILILLLGGLGFFGREALRRMDAVERQLAAVSAKADEAAAASRQAIERAAAAEASAAVAAVVRQAAEAGQHAAEAETTRAREEAGTARRQAASALEAAAQAQVEADRIRKQAEAEVNRLEQALGQVAETRRTALGLVMNLGSDYLKFEFDKAELRPEDRELLSRIAGILMTSQDYSVSVNGHTDDVGTEEYNQKLSERRAEAVRDYLVTAGVPADILEVVGHGKSLPLVRGNSEAARAKNRRVELAIATFKIQYGNR